MNHQPFETWLLDEKILSASEKRELNSHVRECKTCSALAETGLALRSARAVFPAPGFALRFQEKLAAQKMADRRRRLWGMILLIFSGAGTFAWFSAPVLYAFFSAPVEWLTAAIGYFLFLFTSLQAVSDLVGVLSRMLPGFIPPFAWMVLLSAMSGLGLVWVVSIWRFSRPPQGVPA